jgi:endoglucanase
MLSMQDADGGVWHKQTSEKFCGFVMPEKDKLISYIIGTGSEPFKSSCATGDFAAVMAIAARIYRPFDAKFAQTCLEAARKAFAWIEKNPAVLFHNPAGISTGDYGDRHCEDEALWAAAELWRSTQDAAYERYFLGHYQSFVDAIDPPGWTNVAPLALWTYVLGHGTDGAGAMIRKSTIEAADRFVARAAANPYHTTMTARNYVWGSNGTAANYGLELLVANAMQPDARYVDTALDNLHYLLGRNTFSLCWVTRIGANPFRHPHHRPSGADENAEPWPGLLSGGPNHSKQDPAMRRMPDLPPARMYLDEQESYASNEVAINWNAPLVFMLAALVSQR